MHFHFPGSITAVLSVSLVVATATAADPLTVENLTVKLIEQRDVPARETGLLIDLTVREGDAVRRNQILAKVDDRKARLEEKLAATQMSIANKRAENPYASQLAEKDLDQQQELHEQQKLVNDIAHRKAESRIRVMAAEKAAAVAKNELARATQARQEFVDSVSRSEIDGLTLAHQRSQLETQQAEFERQIDALTAQSEDRASRIQAIKLQQSRIALDQAIVDQEIAQLQAAASEQTARLAGLAIERHQVISPIDGVVVHRYKQPGEWVKSGDPIVRVVHLSRLAPKASFARVMSNNYKPKPKSPWCVKAKTAPSESAAAKLFSSARKWIRSTTKLRSGSNSITRTWQSPRGCEWRCRRSCHDRSRRSRFVVRADLIRQRIEMGGRFVWVLKDPLSRAFFYFSDREFSILKLLDGRRKTSEIIKACRERLAPDFVSAESVIAFLADAKQSGLITSTAARIGSDASGRGGERAQPSRWKNLLAIRFPGVNPDRLLDAVTPRVRPLFSPLTLAAAVLLAGLAMISVFARFDQFASDVTAAATRSSWSWLITVAIVISLTKIIHGLRMRLPAKLLQLSAVKSASCCWSESLVCTVMFLMLGCWDGGINASWFPRPACSPKV